MPVELTLSQRKALEHVAAYARSRKSEADQAIGDVLRLTGIGRASLDEAVAKLQAHAPVALHFHPDRPDHSMKSVAEALLEQGEYKSQFETMLSSGSVSAYPGGERDIWEERMFGGAYQTGGAANSERPKYGALNVMQHPEGPAPRFGSCYFLLSPAVSRRCTFTYLDSHLERREKGTFEEFGLIAAALLKDAHYGGFAIGERELTVQKLLGPTIDRLEKPFAGDIGGESVRNLDHYIEAQIHGGLSLEEDVELLVADPCFKGTGTGKLLELICRRYSIRLYWHMGFFLKADEVPTDFRGPSMPSLARRIARNGEIDAFQIGCAAMDLKRNPAAWSGRGDYPAVLQELKQLWHVLVQYGHPRRTPE